MNVLSGVVLINNVKFKKFEKPIRKLADRGIEKIESIKIFQSDSVIRLNKLIALLCIWCFWSNMHTDECVLIPRQK